MVRVKAVREKSGDRILPAIYSTTTLPSCRVAGSSHELRQLEEADTRGEKPKLVIG